MVLKVNNNYWIATENYGVLKATYKEAGDKRIGYFEALLVDGYLILNQGILGYKPRGVKSINPPKTPERYAPKEEWLAMGWQR